jgi:hypothetical protein
MELILSAISAGGLVGVADQYLCLLIVAIAARTGIIQLTTTMGFMSSIWFIVIVGIFWIVTIAPSYATLLSPGVMHVVNTVVRFISSFLVPFSSALISLASAGFIAGMSSEMGNMLETLKIFNHTGGIGPAGIAVAGASAVIGVSLTGMRALARPVTSVATGTHGFSTPIITTLENIASVVLMIVVYLLSKINPWLLVALLGIVIMATIALFIYAIYQLKRLKKGVGRVLLLTQTNPRAGLAIVVEFFIWGMGWLTWGVWGRGIIMLLAWIVFIGLILALQPTLIAVIALAPPLLFPVVIILSAFYFFTGLGAARSLLKHLEMEGLAEKTNE